MTENHILDPKEQRFIDLNSGAFKKHQMINLFKINQEKMSPKIEFINKLLHLPTRY
jgi:hypothetical protein